MNVLAIGAHPDDLEILCGGTLAKYAEQGDSVFMAVATNGEVGSNKLSRDETAKVRYEEALASCSRIGAELIWMGYHDQWLFDGPEVRTKFIDVIRQAKPEVMFVHGADDYHPDHRTSGRVALDARVPSGVCLVETSLPAVEKVPHVFVMDNVGGLGFLPELYVDVGKVWDTKRSMLEEHASQLEYMRSVYKADLNEQMETLARKRGLEAGCQYAEGFKEAKAFPTTGSPALLPA